MYARESSVFFYAYTLIQFQTIYSHKIYSQFWTGDQTLIFLAVSPSTYLLLCGDIFPIQTIGETIISQKVCGGLCRVVASFVQLAYEIRQNTVC